MSSKATQKVDPSSFMTLPTTSQLSIPQRMQLAAQQIDAGQLFEAEKILREILVQQPGQPFALHLLGLIAHKTGRAEVAIELIGKAISTLPSVALFYRNRGEMLRLLKRYEEAISDGEKAIAIDPSDAVAHSNLGIAWYDMKSPEKAEACQRRALEIDPKLVQAINNLGSIHRDAKDKEAALEFFRQALAIAPNYLEARNNMAAVLNELERPEEALPELARVVQARPNYADAHCNFGSSFLILENLEKATAAFSNALKMAPDSVAAMLGMGRVFREQDRFGEAHTMVQRALAIEPHKAESHTLLGDIYAKSERYEEARGAYLHALELDPANSGARLGIGQIALELGNQDEAQANFQQAMDADPKELSPHVSMVHARKVKPDDASLQRLESEAAHIETLPATKAMSLHFALGKAYDDLKAYDKAFPHFLAGCSLKRARIQYDADNQDLAVRNIIEFFSPEKIDALRGGGDPSHVPIFVLGMPRSGTTLVETILASHHEVFGAGELPDLLDIANHPREGMQTPGFPLSMQGVTKDDLTRMGQRYVAGLLKRNPEARYITDKMPANFLALGLIHLMLPNAKIVHVKRNAADVCLSGFTKLFNSSQYHSYDLIEMGRYYVGYAKLMEHWRQVLPKDAFLEIQYETLVSDREAQTRRLISFCGLDWDDACLEHHKTERSVKTASITQVRQPIYQSSVERWRHYEQFLGPLLETLGEYA